MSLNKSFIKWAGGKIQSVRFINDSIGSFKGRFVEPFVGSGVVSANIYSNSYIISDYNLDLINTYKTIKSDPLFIDDLREMFSGKYNNMDKFYELRLLFNETIDTRMKSLIFVYLNRHCFNGLCRYNKSGGFNVPFGRYKSPYFPEKELLFFKNILLPKCDIYCQSFEKTFELLGDGDLCYCDPPYTPLNNTASFTDYSIGGFSERQHIDLAKLAYDSNCTVIISNHDTEMTRDIYSKADLIRTRLVSRFISASVGGRKPVYELLAIYNKEN